MYISKVHIDLFLYVMVHLNGKEEHISILQ